MSQYALPAGFPKRPILIGSEIYRTSRYGRRHPLSIARVSTVMDLAWALGWVDNDTYLDSPRAEPEQLCRFHAPDYVAAVMEAERTGWVSEAVKQRHNIGLNGNPVFAEIFSRPATAAGASLLAGRALANQSRGIIHSLAGGTHHGQPDRASGFCFFNDPALAILTMLDGGLERVLYIDLDAHHGDGVQDAFAAEERVLTVSVHEAGRWPGTGLVEDRADGMARNLPVPADFNDDELAVILDHALLPLGRDFMPDALVLQTGADGLADDPQSRMALSNGALWRAVEALLPLAPRVLVVGGGGYNPWSVARAWAGIWGTLNGLEIPVRLPAPAEKILRDLTWNHSRGRNPPEHWFTTLEDAPNHGPVRDEVWRVIETVMT